MDMGTNLLLGSEDDSAIKPTYFVHSPKLSNEAVNKDIVSHQSHTFGEVVFGFIGFHIHAHEETDPRVPLLLPGTRETFPVQHLFP